MTKQECAIKYITDNYLNFNRLRHDVIADKLQIRIADSLENASLQNTPMGLQFSDEDTWREMTKHDINSIVCHAAQEYDANITSREVITALQSDLIPDVHPLREYVLSCHTWTEDQPDWIDFVARQVHVVDASNIDRTRGAVDRAEPCRSASPEDRPTGCSVSRKSTASITSDLKQTRSGASASRNGSSPWWLRG